MAGYQAVYDTIIWGSGLGAMICGTLLSRKGQRVLIADEVAHSSDLFSVSIAGRRYPRGPALLLGMEKDGYWDRLLTQLGLSLTRFKRQSGFLKRPEPFLQVVTESFRLNLELHQDQQLAEYKREWGDALGALRKFHERLGEWDSLIYGGFFPRHSPPGPLSLRDHLGLRWKRWREHRLIRKTAGQTAWEGLADLLFPGGYLQVLDALLMLAYGGGTRQASLLDLLKLAILGQREILQPAGGLLPFYEAIERDLVAHRGEARYGIVLRDIRKGRDRSWTLTTESGEHWTARNLVIHQTWDSAAPPAGIGPSLFFSVSRDAIPTCLGDHVFVYPPDRFGILRGRFLILDLLDGAKESAATPECTLRATVIVEDRALSPHVPEQELVAGVTGLLHWLMPFSEKRIHSTGLWRPGARPESRPWEQFIPTRRLMRLVRTPYFTYARPRFDRSLYFLPREPDRYIQLPTAARSAEEVARQLARRPA